ncbi:hypothetical protein [Streptomyces clavifer]
MVRALLPARAHLTASEGPCNRPPAVATIPAGIVLLPFRPEGAVAL